MSKFKVGDKVRCIRDGHFYISYGRVYTVRYSTDSSITVTTDNGGLGCYDVLNFELVETNNTKPQNGSNIERYIIKKDCTIVFWTDKTKTVVKLNKEDEYDKRLGFLYAYFQKMSGLTRNQANKFIENLVEEEPVIKEEPKIPEEITTEQSSIFDFLHSLKAGDKVKIIQISNGASKETIGKIGTITRAEFGEYEVKFDDTQEIWYYDINELELVKEENNE